MRTLADFREVGPVTPTIYVDRETGCALYALNHRGVGWRIVVDQDGRATTTGGVYETQVELYAHLPQTALNWGIYAVPDATASLLTVVEHAAQMDLAPDVLRARAKAALKNFRSQRPG